MPDAIRRKGADALRDFVERFRSVALAPVLVSLLMCIVLFLLASMDMRGDSVAALEARTAAALSEIAGVGKAHVVIRTRGGAIKETGGVFTRTQEEQIPCGAVAVMQGAEDPLVRMKAAQALCSLLGLQASQVDVLDMEEE